MEYDFDKTVSRGVKRALSFGVPLLISIYAFLPTDVINHVILTVGASTITIGAIIEMIINWYKNKDNEPTPKPVIEYIAEPPKQ